MKVHASLSIRKKGNQKRKGKKSFVNMKQNEECLILNDLQRPPPLPRAKYFTVTLHAPLSHTLNPTCHEILLVLPFKQIQNATTTGPGEDYCDTLKKLPNCTFTPLIQYSGEGSFLNTEHTVFLPCSTPPSMDFPPDAE